MKKLAGIVVFTVGLILLYGVSSLDDFPSWGTPDSPANKSPLSQYFIKNTIVDTEVPNMVTAVLADYRGYDTMFETVVIFVAGLGIFAVVRVLNSVSKFGKICLSRSSKRLIAVEEWGVSSISFLAS